MKLLFLIVFMAGLLLPIDFVQAAMCSGNNCTGLFADSSCGATGTGTPFTENYAYIEMLQSTFFYKVQWTRQTDKNSSAKWSADATRRIGGGKPNTNRFFSRVW